ncbi:hypothetical protein [Paenibacillus sp. MSJ-34]|nr:hypothetical protein [Paenibacillus sp. MSJ-34]MBU5445655.1 hypothetical protein [Paenibacillus sp. MSJ-34]
MSFIVDILNVILVFLPPLLLVIIVYGLFLLNKILFELKKLNNNFKK